MPDLNLSPAIPFRRAPVTGTPHDLVVLTYDERMLRRKRLVTAMRRPCERRAETMGPRGAFAAATRAVWGYDLPDMPDQVAIGRAAGQAGLPPVPVAQVFLQMTLSNLLQAAQRLMPLGQTTAQKVLAELSPLCAMVANDAATAPLDDIGWAAFAVASASMRHAGMEPGMVRS